jgi:hypothetical protein
MMTLDKVNGQEGSLLRLIACSFLAIESIFWHLKKEEGT